MADVDIDLVTGFAQQAKFYRKDNKDFVEISFIGNPDTVIRKVTPEVMAQYRDAWNAYCDGTPMQQRKGTPLSDLKEMVPERAEELVRRNVHNLEELAALSDHQCQGLGHGNMTLRKAARELLRLRSFRQREENHKRITDTVVKPLESSHEVRLLEETVKQQGEKIDALIAMLERVNKPVVTRKKKKNGPKLSPGHSEPSV